jgi:hypothetical protein
MRTSRQVRRPVEYVVLQNRLGSLVKMQLVINTLQQYYVGCVLVLQHYVSFSSVETLQTFQKTRNENYGF